MTVKEIENQAKQRMDKAMADMVHAMTSIRTGRANIAMLDAVKVEAWGSLMPLNQVATLQVPEPAMITAQPFDAGQIGAIEKAIRGAGLGLNPQNDGRIIRIPIPALTTERRREFVKHLHDVAENHRVGMRNARRDANDALKKLLKDKAISEDDEKRAVAEVQKMLDGSIKKLDDSCKAKEKEIMDGR